VNEEEKRRKAKESTHPKTLEEGFSMLVPWEISFSVDIPTQVADDIPMQPQQSDAEDDGADGNANIGQNSAEEGAGAAGGVVLIDVVGGNNRGNKDCPPRPTRYGDNDSDILGPDYCAFCDTEPCM
jgi:hypothetical protein